MGYENENKDDLNMEPKNKKNKIEKTFIQFSIKKGNKILAEKFYASLLKKIKIKTKQKPFFILMKVIQNLWVTLKLKKIPTKKNISFFQLKLLNEFQQIKLSLQWIFEKGPFRHLDENIIQIYRQKQNFYEKKKKYFLFINQFKFNIKK